MQLDKNFPKEMRVKRRMALNAIKEKINVHYRQSHQDYKKQHKKMWSLFISDTDFYTFLSPSNLHLHAYMLPHLQGLLSDSI